MGRYTPEPEGVFLKEWEGIKIHVNQKGEFNAVVGEENHETLVRRSKLDDLYQVIGQAVIEVREPVVLMRFNGLYGLSRKEFWGYSVKGGQGRLLDKRGGEDWHADNLYEWDEERFNQVNQLKIDYETEQEDLKQKYVTLIEDAMNGAHKIHNKLQIRDRLKELNTPKKKKERLSAWEESRGVSLGGTSGEKAGDSAEARRLQDLREEAEGGNGDH